MVMNGVILSLSCHKSIILCVCVCVGECECACVVLFFYICALGVGSNSIQRGTRMLLDPKT